MKCGECLDKLYRFMDHDLDDGEWAQVDIHIRECRACFDRHELEVQIKQRLEKSCCLTVCTEKLRLRVRAILDRF